MGIADHRVLEYLDSTAPRYTSYPPATCFNETFGQDDYARALEQAGQQSGPLSLYLHVPFCFRQCYYCACNRVVSRRRERADGYLRSLIGEIELVGKRMGTRRPVMQMHWGGGTPTYLSAGQITELMHALTGAFSFSAQADREYSIEIDPREADEDTLALLRGLGFNRISLGVQDFDERVQRAVNRVQSEALVGGLVEAGRRFGFDSISFDLIYGLPLQRQERFEQTLRKAIAMCPDRMSIFNYAHLPDRFPAQRMIEESDLPTPSEKLRMLEMAIDMLTTAGYRYIGMDHFALPEDALARAQQDGTLTRNFQGYSTWGNCDLVGLGASSISQLGDSYSQNHPRLSQWRKALAQGQFPVARGYHANDDDQLRRDVIRELSCRFRLDMRAVEQAHGICFEERFAEEMRRLQPMIEKGFVERTTDELQVTDDGRLLVRQVCSAFDAHLHMRPELNARHSRVI